VTNEPIGSVARISRSKLDDAIRDHIVVALRATRGRIEGLHGAAALLDINPHTLRAKMRRLGIRWQQYRFEA
jgi:transcriptional regulator with GAF, ATPase, and Fis domain